MKITRLSKRGAGTLYLLTVVLTRRRRMRLRCSRQLIDIRWRRLLHILSAEFYWLSATNFSCRNKEFRTVVWRQFIGRLLVRRNRLLRLRALSTRIALQIPLHFLFTRKHKESAFHDLIEEPALSGHCSRSNSWLGRRPRNTAWKHRLTYPCGSHLNLEY